MMFDFLKHKFYDSPSDEGGSGGDPDPQDDGGSEVVDDEPIVPPVQPVSPVLAPKSRHEKFLAKIAGDEIAIQPKSRREKFLNKIAENSGGAPAPTPTPDSSSESGADIFLVNFVIEMPSEDDPGGNDGGKSGGSNTKSGTKGVGSGPDITADKTIPEIIEAYRSGKIVRGRAVVVESETEDDGPVLPREQFPKSIGQKKGDLDSTEEESDENQVFYLELHAIYSNFGSVEFRVVQKAMYPEHFNMVYGDYSYDEEDEESVYMPNWIAYQDSMMSYPDPNDNEMILQTDNGTWTLVPKVVRILEQKIQVAGCYALGICFNNIAAAFNAGVLCFIDGGVGRSQVLNCYGKTIQGEMTYGIDALLDGKLVSWSTTNPNDTGLSGLTRPLIEENIAD